MRTAGSFRSVSTSKHAALDGSYYELWRVKARIASFVAIARGDVPAEHWLALGRTFGVVGDGGAAFLGAARCSNTSCRCSSCNSFENSLLDEACRQPVSAQIDFAARHNVPWGISEAAFSALDSTRFTSIRRSVFPAWACDGASMTTWWSRRTRVPSRS